MTERSADLSSQLSNDGVLTKHDSYLLSYARGKVSYLFQLSTFHYSHRRTKFGLQGGGEVGTLAS